MNLQNIPRSDKTVKRAFVPKLDAFLFADYKQIELRLLAFYLASIGHDEMANLIAQGVDLHTETAKGLFGPVVDEEKRQIGKTLNFAVVYGGGVGSLTRLLNCKSDEAFFLLREFHKRWPGIGWATRNKPAEPGTLIDEIDRRILERGYITTLWGRRLNPEFSHKRLNALVQGCAADLMRQSVVNVWRFTKANSLESHLVNVIHDEVMLDARFTEISVLRDALPGLLNEARVNRIVPIEIDLEFSLKSWADKEPISSFTAESFPTAGVRATA